MHDVNLAGVDLNLLPALDALLRTRNVTRAAAAVGLSQPAMSRALARLRDRLGDPLLLRTGTGYALTPRAQALMPELAEAFAHLRAVYRERSFDPGKVERVVRIAAADPMTILLVPALAGRLAREAPGIALRVEGYDSRLTERLSDGSLDLAFALASTPLPPGFSSVPVADDRLALVLRRDHPAAAQARWTLADYARFDHVTVALVGDGRSDIDAQLAARGVQRRIALVTPHFTAALATVAATDFLTTVSAALAGRMAAPFGLVLRAPPLADTALPMTLVCSRLRAADPVLRWLIALVRSEVGHAFATPAHLAASL